METNKISQWIYDNSPYWIENMISSIYGARKLQIERNSNFKKILNELLESQFYSKSDLISLQEEKLRLLIRHAYENVPYYHEVFRMRNLVPEDIKSIDDLKKLPFLDKDIINSRLTDFISKDCNKRKMLWAHTSGTTGRPFGIWVDRKVEDMWNALMFRHRGWAGYFYDKLRMTFGGHAVVPTNRKKPPFWRFNIPGRQVHFSTFHLSKNNLPYYIERMQTLGAEVIDGYPSAITIVAQFIVSNRLTIPLKAVVVASEPLYDYQRELMQKAFDCEVFNLYGLAERSCSSGECEKHQGNHLFMEESIVEIVEKDEPIEDGKIGECVGTSLINYTMPLIRYKTGDVTGFKNEDCSCGRGLRLMTKVDTKREDIITTPDGRFISPSILTHPLKPLHGIEKSQIIQEDLENFTVKLVINEKLFSENDKKMLLDGLKERFGEIAKIRIEIVDDIPRTNSGKFRFVISKVPFQV